MRNAEIHPPGPASGSATRRALADRVRIGPFEVDRTTHILSKGGIRVPLQEKQFRLLTVFLQKPHEVLTREELHRALWPSAEYGEFDIGLNQAVRRLRRALGDSARNPRWIETLPRIGYRFIGPPATPVSNMRPTPGWIPAMGISRPLLSVMLGLAAIAVAIWLYATWFGPSASEEPILSPAAAAVEGLSRLI